MKIVILLTLLALSACDKGTEAPHQATPQAVIQPAPPESAQAALSDAHQNLTTAPAELNNNVDMVLVPGGPFIVGSDEVDTENRAKEFGGRRVWYQDEHPAHQMTIGTFRIDRTEVSEGAYKKFIDAIGYPPPPHWVDLPDAPERPDFPMVNTNWMDAQNYCHWRGARLPTEFEWEKAARGTDGRHYPWGKQFDRNRANTGQLGDLAPVGHFEESASPYGALDLAGNVWEWTANWYQAYPGNTDPSEQYGRRYKVLRGGSSGGDGGHYQLEVLTNRSSYRFFLDPRMQVPDVGFRCLQRLDDDGFSVDDHDNRLHG
jgi:formylglycine-generating enzyme required for sulfatase activity